MRFKILFILLILISFGVILTTLVYITPERVVEYIGMENSYLAIFTLSLIGGTTILVPFPYYVFTISFGAAGINPLLLGISGALGTVIGDTFSYLLGKFGSKSFIKKEDPRITKVLIWLNSRHPILVPIFIYVYTSIAPLSDDLIMVPAGVINYPYKKLIIPIFLGKTTFNTLMALIGLYGWNLIF